MIIVTINNQILKMKKLPFALLAFCCGATLISAKDYKITQNANWMMTLNGEAFHQSRMGKFIMGKINEAPIFIKKCRGSKMPLESI